MCLTVSKRSPTLLPSPVSGVLSNLFFQRLDNFSEKLVVFYNEKELTIKEFQELHIKIKI